MTTAGTEAPFSVLAVCTGNVCRSPAVEVLLSAGMDAGSGVVVRSAGLQARVGEPISPEMAALLAHPFDGFVARQVSRDMVARADVVLTMTRAQRAALVTSMPAAVRKTFTLAEFSDLAARAHEQGGLPPGGRPPSAWPRSPRWSRGIAAGAPRGPRTTSRTRTAVTSRPTPHLWAGSASAWTGCSPSCGTTRTDHRPRAVFITLRERREEARPPSPPLLG